MALTYWDIYLEQSVDTWALDGEIPRPNMDMETTRLSTMSKTKLADGSNAFITPETKMVKEPFTMFFADVTSAFREKIRNYMTNGDKVKIITHTGEIFEGKFISMSRVWLTGVAPDEYDLQVTFEQTD